MPKPADIRRVLGGTTADAAALAWAKVIRAVHAVGAYSTVAFDDPFIESEGKNGGTVYVPRPNPVTELRQHMDQIGATFKGRQDRRWQPPKPDEQKPEQQPQPGQRFAHLRAVG